jgi:YD repeat-containing protein
VLSVSAAGLVTAVGPGKADVSAAYGGVSGSVSAQVVAPPAAYFTDGVEYAFDYRLDAQGRVENYRVSQREGVVYPVGPAGDVNVRECTGSLYGSYRCTGWLVSMTGEAGRLVAVEGSLVFISTTYSYGQSGLAEVRDIRRLSTHQSTDSTSTLGYDADGRLSEVRTSSLIVDWQSYTRTTTATIELDSQDRLLRADIVTCSSWYGGFCAESSTAWTYDLAGFMSSAGTTTYSADADGWLASRQGEGGTLDTYAIVRSGGRVVE